VQVDVDRRMEVGDDDILAAIKSDQPYPHAYLDIQPPREAYETVLADAGAIRPRRDAVDERIVKMVRTGQVTSQADVGGLAKELQLVGYSQSVIDGIVAAVAKGIISGVDQVGGYPEYVGQPYADVDSDGMPDDWEIEHGLNPRDAADAAGDENGDGYTNIEDFLNGLDPRAAKTEWPAPRTYEDHWGDLDS
jgi:hypothetical protein